MNINDVYLLSVTGVAALVSISTVFKLVSERERLKSEDLSDEDRAFAWRVVIFLLFPLVTFLDLRSTTVVTELLGGYIKDWGYGLMWYHALPAGLSKAQVLTAALAGEAVTTIFALCLIPALFFRPHPFMSTVIGYACAFTLALNFIIEPVLYFAGIGSMRWQLITAAATPAQLKALLVVQALCALLLIAILRNGRIRLWFSALSRPQISQELRQTLLNLQAHPESARLALKVGLLYQQAGLGRQTRRQIKRLKEVYGRDLYANFLQSLLSYNRRDYKKARQAFVYTSDFPSVDGELKASLLAAAACSAFAAGDTIGALNLCERALEFDDRSLVARMVKVDVFLKQGKKEQAGEEILASMRLGLELDLKNKVPLDCERAYECLIEIEERQTQRGLASLTTRI